MVGLALIVAPDVEVLFGFCQHLRYGHEVQDGQFLSKVLVFQAQYEPIDNFLVGTLSANGTSLHPVCEFLQRLAALLSQRVKCKLFIKDVASEATLEILEDVFE